MIHYKIKKEGDSEFKVYRRSWFRYYSATDTVFPTLEDASDWIRADTGSLGYVMHVEV